jgi:hypothetical protein
VLARSIIVGGLALLASAQVVRTAIVSAFGDEQPVIAERVWPSHPEVKFAVAMAEIGAVAASGKTAVPESTLGRVKDGMNAAPLAVEPYLIRGALAQSEGRSDLAERLFLEARARDPRSAAARYFLAERFLASGRAAEGLTEISVLARLVPGGSQLLVPALVRYARAPGSEASLKATLAANPQVGQAVLAVLATDASNADLIMRIAGPLTPGNAETPPPAWQGRLLSALVEKGEFVRARDLWRQVSGIVPATPAGLVNSRFAELNAPPPFNWSLSSGSFGIAEPAEDGQLKVIFYGREDAELASQLLLLPAGQYRLQMEASGDAADDSGLEWSVICLPSKAKLAGVPLKGATLAAKSLGATFAVPGQGCEAQWLKLTGTAAEFAKSEQATIGKLSLSPLGGR